MNDKSPQKKREEGIFYDKKTASQWGECCEQCCDVHFEKTYPAHTAYLACTNLKCECHTPAKVPMTDVMKQVDKQVGRAVKRLGSH